MRASVMLATTMRAWWQQKADILFAGALLLLRCVVSCCLSHTIYNLHSTAKQASRRPRSVVGERDMRPTALSLLQCCMHALRVLQCQWLLNESTLYDVWIHG
jgi:hypothetical protein